MGGDSAVFTAEQIEPLAMAAIEAVLGGQQYVEGSVDGWVNSICEDIIAALAGLEKPFKFMGERNRKAQGQLQKQLLGLPPPHVYNPPSPSLSFSLSLSLSLSLSVNCIIMQNIGAGVHSAISEFCDGAVDGTCVARWPTEKDKDKTNILCIATIYGVANFVE